MGMFSWTKRSSECNQLVTTRNMMVPFFDRIGRLEPGYKRIAIRVHRVLTPSDEKVFSIRLDSHPMVAAKNSFLFSVGVYLCSLMTQVDIFEPVDNRSSQCQWLFARGENLTVITIQRSWKPQQINEAITPKMWLCTNDPHYTLPTSRCPTVCYSTASGVHHELSSSFVR